MKQVPKVHLLSSGGNCCLYGKHRTLVSLRSTVDVTPHIRPYGRRRFFPRFFRNTCQEQEVAKKINMY